MIENKMTKKKFFPAKIDSGEALFPPLVKAKNKHQNFKKHLKQRRCTIRLLLFFLKNQFNMVKNVKNCLKYAIFNRS